MAERKPNKVIGERDEREEDGEDKLWGYRQRSSPAREYNAGTIMEGFGQVGPYMGMGDKYSEGDNGSAPAGT